MAPPGSMYAKDEKVLCFHHKLLYEAKVTDLRVDEENEIEGTYEYKVHYKGWKNTWDDWVPMGRLRKLTDENRELAKSLRVTETSRQSATRKSLGGASTASAGGTKKAAEARPSIDRSNVRDRGTKRKLEGIEKEEDFMRRPSVKMHIPDTLKLILVDDWEKVTKEQKIVPLPSSTPVATFLDEYADQERPKRRAGSADADILDEIIAGMIEYFNKCLGRLLLYRLERPQWQDIHAQINKSTGELSAKRVVDVYGVEHLLRLFVSMPDLIAQTNMDAQAVARLREELFKMTQYLAKHTDRYLTTEYEHVGNDYGRD